MATSRARAALDAWLAQVEEVLGESREPEGCGDGDEEPVEHGDAA